MEEKEKVFPEDIFSLGNFEILDALLDMNAEILTENENYKKYSTLISDLIEKARKESNNGEKENDVLKLEQLHCLCSNYENSLFYHLGLKRGIALYKLK